MHSTPNAICPNPAALITSTHRSSAAQRPAGREQEGAHVYVPSYATRIFHCFFFSRCQFRKHACTPQPHYMLFGCLMRAGEEMENAPSGVCLMAGFCSFHRAAGTPGWSRQHPSAGHCTEEEKILGFSQVASSPSKRCRSAAQHADEKSLDQSWRWNYWDTLRLTRNREEHLYRDQTCQSISDHQYLWNQGSHTHFTMRPLKAESSSGWALWGSICDKNMVLVHCLCRLNEFSKLFFMSMN